jgi:hypothetical protein
MKIIDNSWLLRQRVLRTIDKKVVISGRQEDLLNPDIFSQPPEDFVRMLYRSILARFEEPLGFDCHVATLSTGNCSKTDKIQEFLESNEYQDIPRLALFDLNSDPYEEAPLPLAYDLVSYIDSYLKIKKIRDMNSQTAAAEKIFSPEEPAYSQEEENEIRERLNALGYLD